MIPAPSVTVCSRKEAAVLFGAHLASVLSIGSAWRDSPPRGLRKLQESGVFVRRLLFDDVLRSRNGYEACTAEHVRQIIEHAPRIATGQHVVHCLGGYSRSTASTLVMLTALHGPGSERDACVLLPALCMRAPHEICPNERIVWFADRLLGRGGRLYETAAEAFGFMPGFETEPDAEMMEVGW